MLPANLRINPSNPSVCTDVSGPLAARLFPRHGMRNMASAWNEDSLDGRVRRRPDGYEAPPGVGDGGHDLRVHVQDRRRGTPIRRQAARVSTAFRGPS